MKEVVLFPNPVLRKWAKKVNSVDERLKREIMDLEELLQESQNGAALAAPQTGVSRRFFAKRDRGQVQVLINPEITKTFGGKEYPMIDKDDGSQESFLEGCLSFPGYYGGVKRWGRIGAGWQEVRGGKLVKKSGVLEGFEAILFQHERDHLDGVLFVDHVKKEKGKFFKWEEGKMVKKKIKDWEFG